MNGHEMGSWWRTVAASMLPLLLLGCSFIGPTGAHAQGSVLLTEPLAGIRVGELAGYREGGSLGFRLRDTTIAEEVFRRAEGGERAVVWTAQFASRWPLTEDQLDRWSAQAIGHLADGLETNVRLAGWERLAANDVGEQRVAYRYRLADPNGSPVGEATLVVFSRGDQVGIAGTAGIGSRPPLDAATLARALDGARS